MTATKERRKQVALPPNISDGKSVTFNEYQKAVHATDKLPPGDLSTPILGLFGEIGGVLAIIKKKRRDASAYTTYNAAILEELGDTLWYLTCIADRAGLNLSVLAQRVFRELEDWDECGTDNFGTWGDIQSKHVPVSDADVLHCMSTLAAHAGELVGHLHTGKLKGNRDTLSGDLVSILRALISTADAANVDLDLAARENLTKIYSRYPVDTTYPALVDADMPLNERLPRKFEMYIEEHNVNGKTYVIQKCRGLIIGDRLTDNKAEEDDYRFHDVFHMAYAAHLGWSPVLRALFRVKRKSIPKIDDSEDGARAILIEEGISTFIFGRGLERDLFEGLERLDYDLLKLVEDFVRGFEPERCYLWQWERAILDGFAVFRELKKHRRGYVMVDLEEHSLIFRPGSEE